MRNVVRMFLLTLALGGAVALAPPALVAVDEGAPMEGEAVRNIFTGEIEYFQCEGECDEEADLCCDWRPNND